MAGESNESFYKQKHGINIALAAQLRMNDLLDRIAVLDANYPIDSAEKQQCYLNLVRQYFISAIPYLSIPDTRKFEKEISSLGVKKRSDVSKGVQKHNFQFNPILSFKLNSILVNLQIKLRRVFTKIQDDSGDPDA